MKILIIGGTKFLGRHLAEAALARGAQVTLFNRGKHSSEEIEAVEQIRGDRHTELDKLDGRSWDAVIDTCGYLPQTVKLSAEKLKTAVDRYVFVSSISAYADFSQPNFDETAPLAELTPEQAKRAGEIDLKADITAAVLGEMYGALKAQCEKEVEKAMPGRALIVRPGLIVGAFDPTDRFTYWVMRASGGGELLAPGDPKRFVQLIDVRDLAEWIVKMIEDGQTGVYNATGKPRELTMEKMLGEIKAETASRAEFIWADEDFLTREAVAPWSDMPLYLPESDKSLRGFLAANVDRALAAGLKFRPLRETVRDTFNWRKTIDEDLKAGIGLERERELLRKWREQ